MDTSTRRHLLGTCKLSHINHSFLSSSRALFNQLFSLFQQRAIEILLEQGADINAKTNNNETVLELCDDQDVRDFIVQKSKEIENKQQQAAAAAAARAALQIKLHLINSRNTSVDQFSSLQNPPSVGLSTGSISNLNTASVNAFNNSSISNVNNSSRSLKRTSTGVSRRSAFFL